MIFDEFLTSRKESLILCAFTVLTDNVTLSEEHLAYRWVTPAELPSYRLHGSLQRSLKQMKQFSYEKSHALLRGFLSAI